MSGFAHHRGNEVPGLRLSWAATLAGIAAIACAQAARAQDESVAEPDPLADIESLEPDDPLFVGTGTWGQAFEDQWALRSIGFVERGAGRSAWDGLAARGPEVLIAVIDSGVDAAHPDLAAQIWTNPRERADGRDEDGNGLVDDLHGWDFADGDARPQDDSGHGTYLAGIAAARSNDSYGMAGVNASARVLPLRVADAEGRGTGTALVAALDYAARAKARVILLGFPGAGANAEERTALNRALASGSLVVAPAGDTAAEIPADSLAAVDGVLTVAASDRGGARAAFSAWGTPLDLLAPGVEVLGPRARGCDWLARSGTPGYAPRAAQVGGQREHYRASSSSASAALVAGTASLLIARHPALDARGVARVLCQNARDVGSPGFDLPTGCGLLDARAALRAEPEIYVEARIDQVEAVVGAPPRVRVIGTADANLFQNARLELSPAGDERWIQVGSLNHPVRSGTLAELDAKLLDGVPRWLLRVVTRHSNGSAREARFELDLGWR
jgi:subtilisin family serine protease